LKNGDHDDKESDRIRREVRAEVARVTWPTRRETMITTTMVFIFVVISSLFFLVADKVIGFVVKLLLGVS
jgi:preprotein translocase subunit SecE